MKTQTFTSFLFLALLPMGCGDDNTSASSGNFDANISVPQTCLDELPPPKEDCRIAEGKFLTMRTQADVDLICKSTCTAADAISTSDDSSPEALKVLRRLTYIKFASIYGDSATDASIFSRVEKVGNLKIQSGRETFSLRGLENLKIVEGNLSIESKGLRDLQGLNNLELVGKVYVPETMMIYDGGVFTISTNYKLENLDGLESLEEVGQLYIGLNAKLEDIDALSSLKRVNQSIAIDSNPKMKSLRGLDSLESAKGFFHITENSALPQCEAKALLERLGGEEGLGISAEVRIQDNLVTDECF